jgi:hypothetical protein
MHIRALWRLPLAVGVLAAALGLTACSSDNPFTPPARSDLAGVYEFTEFVFTPSGEGIAPADVMARLVPGATSIRLFSNGDVLFQYELQGSQSGLVLGVFDAASDRVRFRFNDPQQRLPAVLLRPEITFTREDEGVLRVQGQTQVNLRDYDPQRYAGTAETVPGVLRITLRRLSS